MEDYFAFQPFGTHNDDDLDSRDALPTPAAALGYLSPFDSPTSTFPDPETPKPRRGSVRKEEKVKDAKEKGKEKEGKEKEGKEKEKEVSKGTNKFVEEARKKPVLSPSELVTVLDRDGGPPPPPSTRFLHGGQPLHDLEAPSASMPNSDKPVANSEWRAFTDEEEKKLQEGWENVRELKEKEKVEKESKANVKRDEKNGRGRIAEDPNEPDPLHLVPVGLDNLFTVDLAASVLFPAFWVGSKVRLIRSHWFYAPPSVPSSTASLHSHQLKPYPVDPSLSLALDRAYSTIRPWDTSYEAEFSSALKGGSDAQKRLCVALGLENESGADASADLGIEVIFEKEDRGRVYSKGMIASVSKSFWSSGKGLGGGQVVLRGWDAFRSYIQEQAEKAEKKKKPSKSQLNSVASDHTASDTDSDANNSSRSPSKNRTKPRSDSNASQAKTEPASSGFFSSLRNRFVGTASSTDGHSTDGEAEGRTSIDSVNDTAAALEGPRKEDAPSTSTTKEEKDKERKPIGEVDELVLVIHGVGQLLARQYESFNFTLAVNQFRSACTTLSTSPTLSPLLHGKRAQFIPINWRTDLDLGLEVDQSADAADEHLANRFSVQDIEIQNSVPFLRSIVSGLVLDVPFYLSPGHKEKMVKAVVREANRIYRLFCKRNPNFGGKVSIIAHSLGSCIAADILSNQPNSVNDLADSFHAAQDKELAFCFDTRTLFLVGSPLAFFLHLGKGQLIARAGKERTQQVGKDIALDRAGRYGCMAVEAVYNIYHEADPVAFALNPCVDVRYSKLIKPVPIASANQTLLQNLSSAYYRVSKIFDFSSLWGSSTAAAAKSASKQTGSQAKEQAEEQKKETTNRLNEIKQEASKQARPGNKRMPSEMPKFGMGKAEFEWVGRAEKRMKALNPSGTVDYFLPAEGINQYIDALTAHQDYWEDKRFSTFILTQLFSSQEELEKAVRDEIGEVAEE